MAGSFSSDFNADFDGFGQGVVISIALLPAPNTFFRTSDGLVLAIDGLGPIPPPIEFTQGKYRPTTYPSAVRPWKY
jgi:hypothetical protein